MATIVEKYEKFLLTDELIENFSKLSEIHNPYCGDTKKVEVKTFQKENTINGSLAEKLDNA